MSHTRLGVERPGEGQHLSKGLTAGTGVAGVTQMPWFPGITTNRQKEHRQSLWRQGEELFWACALPGTHSSNFPSRICSKEKGRNLKPAPE